MPGSIALKEWSIVCSALATGRQSILLRKGGIREKRGEFTVEHQHFFLYPTAFHQDPEQLIPEARAELGALETVPVGQVSISLYAEVVAVWRIEDLEKLKLLAPLHILAWPTIESRFRYKNNPWLEVLLLRVLQLPKMLLIPEFSEYAGCRSWVSLREELAPEGSTPVIEDTAFHQLQQELEALLGKVND
jgi:hypothetical protein